MALSFDDLQLGKMYVWKRAFYTIRKMFPSDLTDFNSPAEILSRFPVSEYIDLVEDQMVVLLGKKEYVQTFPLREDGLYTYWIRVLFDTGAIGWIKWDGVEWNEAKP